MPGDALVLALTWGAGLAIALSIAAFLFGLAGFVFGFKADRRADRAEDMARRADERSGRAERRDEERLKREREEADAAKRAELAIWPEGSSASVDDRRFGFKIINHGQAPAHDVRVWLFNERGEEVSIKPQRPFTLEPGEADDRHGVTLPLEVEPLDVRFGIGWIDGTGHHKQLFWALPPAL